MDFVSYVSSGPVYGFKNQTLARKYHLIPAHLVFFHLNWMKPNEFFFHKIDCCLPISTELVVFFFSGQRRRRHRPEDDWGLAEEFGQDLSPSKTRKIFLKKKFPFANSLQSQTLEEEENNQSAPEFDFFRNSPLRSNFLCSNNSGAFIFFILVLTSRKRLHHQLR